MVLIGLGTVTIVAMILWFFTCVIGLIRPVKGAKLGIGVMYAVAVAWGMGLIL